MWNPRQGDTFVGAVKAANGYQSGMPLFQFPFAPPALRLCFAYLFPALAGWANFLPRLRRCGFVSLTCSQPWRAGLTPRRASGAAVCFAYLFPRPDGLG